MVDFSCHAVSNRTIVMQKKSESGMKLFEGASAIQLCIEWLIRSGSFASLPRIRGVDGSLLGRAREREREGEREDAKSSGHLSFRDVLRRLSK